MNILLSLFVSIATQAILLFLFYRKILRPLPREINRYILDRHLEGSFVDVSLRRAEIVKNELLELEKERCKTIIEYRPLKGKRLSVKDSNYRTSLKKTIKELGDQISELEKEYSELYADGSSGLKCLKKIEENSLISAVNSWIDGSGSAKSVDEDG